MTRLAIGGDPAFELCPIEMERPGPSYTIDSVVELKRAVSATRGCSWSWPPTRSPRSIRWREPDRLLDEVEWASGRGPAAQLPDQSGLEERFGERASRIHLLSGPSLDVSSSEIRRRVAAGHTIRYLVPRERGGADHRSRAVPPWLNEAAEAKIAGGAGRDPCRCRRAGASDRGDRLRQEGQRHRHAAHRRADDAWPTSSSSSPAAAIARSPALSGAIVDELRDDGIRPLGVEGRASSRWVLLDFGAVIVHVFAPEEREYYGLERLWSKATQVVRIV